MERSESAHTEVSVCVVCGDSELQKSFRDPSLLFIYALAHVFLVFVSSWEEELSFTERSTFKNSKAQ